jgi:hypothetical protein
MRGSDRAQRKVVKREITNMKRLLTIALGLTFAFGTFAFADDHKKKEEPEKDDHNKKKPGH